MVVKGEGDEREKVKEAKAGQDSAATTGSEALLEDARPRDKSAKSATDAGKDAGKDTVQDPLEAARAENDRLRLNYLQMTLHNLLPAVVASTAQAQADKGDKTQADKGSALSPEQVKEIKQRQVEIKSELDRGEFGPATKRAYGQYVEWLEGNAIPTQIDRLKAYNLPVEDAASKNLALSVPYKFNINTNKPPDDSQMMRLDGAIEWMQRAEARVKPAEAAMLKEVDDQVVKTIRQNGLPRTWLDSMDSDRTAWREATSKLVNTALSTRTYIELIDELNKSADGIKFSNTTPAGSRIERDENGNIKRINLNLPESWKLDTPQDQKKVQILDEWILDRKKEVAPVVQQLRINEKHPERAVNWGDTELRGLQGRFDASGNLVGLAGKDEKAQAGETLKEINLLQSRFSVEEKNGKIELTQQIQAQSVPWWGYQNLIGVDNVGNQLNIKKTFDKDEMVLVRTHDGFEAMKAQDLGSYRGWEMTKHYGEKGLMTALDVGMVVTGTIEVGAAFKAARIAQVAGELSLKQGGEFLLAKQGGKGLLRATVGGAGVFNNAGARESDAGQYVNTARSVYFLTDISASLAAGGWRAVKSAVGKGSPNIRPALAGLETGTIVDKIYQGSHTVFKASEFGFAPLVVSDIIKQSKNLKDDKSQHIRRATTIDAVENGTR
jgi:hypothetical protein